MSYAKRSRSTLPSAAYTTLDCVLITLTDGAVLAQNVITRTLSALDAINGERVSEFFSFLWKIALHKSLF
jgi:hypothetical protein